MAEYICPHCKNPTYDEDALLCLYCGESLKRSIGVMGKMKYTKPKIIGTILAILVALAFLLLIAL